MDPILTALLQSNEPLDASQARQVRATLDATLTELEDLESQISKTLLSLVKLESERRRRSQYADTLKSALSPIRRTPSEILVEVFLACRDNSLTASNYSITDPREAPMLMGHVSSRWRQVCHGAPRLWNHLQLSTTPRSSKNQIVSQLPLILARSRILPLHVKLEQWSYSPTQTEDLLDLIFKPHERWKDLYLSIGRTGPSAHSLSRIFNRQTLLPILSSITLIGDGTFDAERVFPLFQHAPQLRDVYLDTHRLSSHSLQSTLPWAQLTRLELHSGIELGEAKEILVQCAMLQECALYRLTNDDGLEPPQHVHQLVPLQRFAISAYHEIAPEFLEAFSCPNLLSLDISATTLSHNVLVNLLAGSKFGLEALKLNVHGLKLIPLLQQLPSLRTFDLQDSGADDALFKIFTYDPGSLFPHGRIIADMVESVCAHAGGQNLAFPALATVELHLYGPRFNKEVEDRIAVASVTGLVKDRRKRY
ncbi:hypothetical protein FB451DRAFT_1565573 [Mycena latifolia]|nr:hypothetical protein FB451DRAFT_1565573 [Mycena latifolia]